MSMTKGCHRDDEKTVPDGVEETPGVMVRWSFRVDDNLVRNGGRGETPRIGRSRCRPRSSGSRVAKRFGTGERVVGEIGEHR